MFCPRCGKEARPADAYCARCGAALPGQTAKPAPKRRRRAFVLGAAALCLLLAGGALWYFIARGSADADAPRERPSHVRETAAPAAAPDGTVTESAAPDPEPTPTPLPERDPFSGAVLRFSGVSGAGTAELRVPGGLDPADFGIDPPRALTNGDAVTVRFLGGEARGFRPTRTELEVTVSGLAEYVRTLSALSPAGLKALRADAASRLGPEAQALGEALRGTGADCENALCLLFWEPGAAPLAGPGYRAVWYRDVTDADDCLSTAAYLRTEDFDDPYAWYAARAAEGAEPGADLAPYAAGDGWVRGLADLTPAALDALRADACDAARASLEGEYAVGAVRALGACFVKNNDAAAAAADAGVVALVAEAAVTAANGKAQTLYIPVAYAMVFCTPEGCRCGWEIGALEQDGLPVRFQSLKVMFRTLRLTVGMVYDFELGPELEEALRG